MVRPFVVLAILAATLMISAAQSIAADTDEFKVKREPVFEFAEKPVVTRKGDNVTVRFVSKGFCDVTIAIEDPDGKIIRHLASGVLGANAPAPFKKNSKEQTIVWDGKSDEGVYIDNKDRMIVRVSLGLKPQFEKTLFWSPHKQRGAMPLLTPAPEGIYVFDSTGVDYLRLFDHDGNYVRTIYPFPADKLKSVAGLKWFDFPQGYNLPLKESAYQQTLLTSGDNDSIYDQAGRTGRAATGITVMGNRIALAYEHVNRLATDGSTGGLPLKGPETGLVINRAGYGGFEAGKTIIGPTSMALSPDGKSLYMTGYLWKEATSSSGCLHAVLRADFEKDDKATVFVGSNDLAKFGREDNQLAVPTSVACDPKGNVYVSDFLNDRVQVFNPAGKLLASLKVNKPTKVCINQKTGAIFVFSWEPIGVANEAWKAYKFDPKSVKPGLTRFGPYPECKQLSVEEFPFGPTETNVIFTAGQQYHIELDSWASDAEPVFWVVGRIFIANRADRRYLYIGATETGKWANGIRILKKQDGKWTSAESFGKRAADKVKWNTPVAHNIQKLYVNPANGKLYVGEADSGPTVKAFKQLLEINPATGAVRIVPLPFNAEDIVFDTRGMVYLRSTDVVVRYDPVTWREVPWDYGEEFPEVSCGMYGKSSPVVSGLNMPAVHPVCFHQGGMAISPKGYLAVACGNRPKGEQLHNDFAVFGKPTLIPHVYRPSMYPGREESSTSCCIHVWDKKGKLVFEDAVQGLSQVDGVFIDNDDSIYVMATPTRVLDGKRYFNYMSETVMKFKAGKAKIMTSGPSPIPLDKDGAPKRPQDVNGRWVEGADWFYGGVGYAGFNNPHAGGGCACWYSRFAVDYFSRSFVPEMDQYRVAVLDSAGNLVLRVGKYGNVDDGVPLVKDGGPADPRPIGGDEVGLFHAGFVGTHTDHRLFIADLGNARLLSVKLDYYATEKTPLKDVKDEK
ncbi:MAG: SMP-30/gluconolactonase/LRE family protein [Phycisphaerae bacterium]|nr:SMP-30/gluconolactonase/LRE family protein [Phycisphaerae bacterium]